MTKDKITVSVTPDLTLTFNFEERILDIVSNGWLLKTRKSDFPTDQNQETKKKELPSNKKVRPSKQETQFEKFIELFTLLDEMDTLGEGVSFPQIKVAVQTKGIAKETNEINNLINDALSKDVIEGTEKYGYYKLIKK